MQSQSYKDTDWYKHFESSYMAMKKDMDAFEDIIRVYDVVRKRDLFNRSGQNSTVASGVSSPNERMAKMDSTLLQKSKQIESQQALLNDLQSQLSSKEKEVRDLNARWVTSMNQATQLRAQLEETHKRMQEQEMEVIKLRNELRAIESADKIEIVETLNKAPVVSTSEADNLSSRIPRKVTSTQKLVVSGMSAPTCITSTRSSHGPQIVVVGTNRLHCFNAGTGGIISETDVCSSSSSTILSASVSPENDMVLIGTSENQLSLVDLNGRILKDLKGHGGKVKGCGFVGSKAKAFSVATDRTIKLWDLTRASPIRSVPVTSQLIGGTVTTDGTMMVTCHLNGKVTVWSMQDKICEVDAHTDTCLGVSLSPDGRFITSVGKDDTVAIIDIHMAQCGPIHKLTGFKALAVDTTPSCSADSKIVSVCGSNGMNHWDLVLGNPIGVTGTDPLGLVWTSTHNSDPSNSNAISIHSNGIVKWWSP